MVSYFYAILIAVCFQLGSPHPIIQTSINCCQNQQSCVQCPLPVAPCTSNCCAPGNQCQQPCIPSPIAPGPIPSTTNCCCQQPYIAGPMAPATSCSCCCVPGQVTTASIPSATNCCTSGYQCQQPCTPCPVTSVPIPSATNCYTPGYQCQQPCTPGPVTPVPIPSTTNCGNAVQQFYQSITIANSTPTTESNIRETTTIRPEPLICPKDTIKVHNTCQPVFCGTGIYYNGKCIETKCPTGTVWTGSQCEAPSPHNHTTIKILNTVNTNISYATSHTVNFTNPINIFITESVDTNNTSRPPSPRPCCTVVTPHTCKWTDSQYDCSSRQYRTCSSMCSSSYVYLKPPSFMPISPSSCETNDCFNGHRSFYPDCSNCYDTGYECQRYCRRRSVCQVRQCQSIDIRMYCEQYPGSIGCREMDGCIDDWCNAY